MPALRTYGQLGYDDRLELASELRRVLQVAGYRLSLHPRVDERGVPRCFLHDDEAGLAFVVVPGGVLRPGLTDAQHAKIRAQLRRGDDPGFDDLGPRRDGSEVVVEPMLVSVTPLLATTPAFARTMQPEKTSTTPANPCAVSLDGATAKRVCADWGWAIATYAESCWAALGGEDTIFPWGDDVPGPATDQGIGEGQRARATPSIDPGMLEREIFPLHAFPGEPIVSVRRSGYGLVDMLTARTWVLDRGELRTHGGPGNLVPWQGEDWLHAIVSQRTQPAKIGALRPIVRLCAS